MKSIKELLKIRKEIKRRKPTFVMQDAHKIKCLPKHWRKPRGIDSKIRLNLKGYNKRIQVGYGSPKAVEGCHPSGLMPIMVANVDDLSKLNKEKQGAVIVGSVGMKKRVDIIKKSKELGITLLNIKDNDKFLQAVTDKLKIRKEEKEKRNKKKTEKKVKEEKKKEDKLADKVLTEEEKSAAEKKEKDKLLTKKDI
jgi:large subunit ribosomal protein L32e